MPETTTALVIAEVTITQDLHGRYNLNALHQASGAGEAKKPGNWIKRASTKALKNELETQVSFLTLDVVVGGDRAGTYAHELLAVEYAGWISPAFRLKVNQAFIDSRRAPTLPQVKDPAIQMLIEMAVRLDEARQIADDAKQQAQHAQDAAIQALHGQQWLTIQQYVAIYRLDRQLPPALQGPYGKWLTKYCLEKGLPVYQNRSIKGWEEHTYPIWSIQTTLDTWLVRRHGQPPLALITTH